MQAIEAVELSVSGIVNLKPFRAHSHITVDEVTGTKQGTVTYDLLPTGFVPGPDPTPQSTNRPPFGAKKIGGPFTGPVELLGREFTSTRLTTVGRYGALSVSETARVRNRTLHSELVIAGELKRPPVKGLGSLREVTTVRDDGTLVSHGRYSLLTARGRIPVRYDAVSAPKKPNRALFRRYRGTAFLLRTIFASRARGHVVWYHSRSTLRRLKGG